MRPPAGSNGRAKKLETKTAKVGVALLVILSGKLGAGGARHAPVCGLVSQTSRAPSRAAGPRAVSVRSAVAPTLTLAIEKNPKPFSCGTSVTPLSDGVRAMVTMSATGCSLEDSSSVFRPLNDGAASVLLQVKLKAMSVAPKALPGVTPIRKDCDSPGGMSTGSLGSPVKELSTGLVI